MDDLNQAYKDEIFEKFIGSLPLLFQSGTKLDMIKKAFDFAYKSHYGQFRKGGAKEPYITHPVAVAQIVANEIGLGARSIAAALLHDVIEDCGVTREEIEQLFDETVARVVDGLTKIKNKYNAETNIQAETFKKMLLSLPQDFRVAFIKIADRLHNMRTMDDMPDSQQIIKSGENLYVYVPIAYQLGLYDIKAELEDLSFKYRYPDIYTNLVNEAAQIKPTLDLVFDKVKTEISELIKGSMPKSEVAIINKSLYLSWQKMSDKGLKFSEIHNYKSVRVIFDPATESDDNIMADTYLLYSKIITKFKEKHNSKRDWILQPKLNGFSALVFDVMFEGRWIEIQIVTSDKDTIARKGYSRRTKKRSIAFLNNNNEPVEFDPNENPVELIERFFAYSYNTLIYVFTPKGKIITMPKGATVLDFAFHIHSDIGYRCIGAEINKKIVPISHKLVTTDQINILTAQSEKPKFEWFNHVISAKAQGFLRAWFKRTGEFDYLFGRDFFYKILKEIDKSPTASLIKFLIKEFKTVNQDVLYIDLANKRITREQIIRAIKKSECVGNKKQVKTEQSINIDKFNYKAPYIIDFSIAYNMAICCSPIPGDEALMYIDPEGNIFIHKRTCDVANKLSATQGKQTAKVVWGNVNKPSLTKINIEGTDRVGIILDVTNILSSKRNLNMKSINISSEDNIFSGTIIVYVSNINELDVLISELKSVNGILNVNRIN